MMVRYELRKIYQHMNRDERRKLAQTWGVTLANCTRYCTKPYSTKIHKNRWEKMLTMWPIEVWRARLDEALKFEEIAEQGSLDDYKTIKINVIVPEGISIEITVNGREIGD